MREPFCVTPIHATRHHGRVRPFERSCRFVHNRRMTDSNTPDHSDLLLHERDVRGVHRLTLNQPASFNTLSEAMLAALQKALSAIAQDPDARVVVLAAAGKAFCAGMDLSKPGNVFGLDESQQPTLRDLNDRVKFCDQLLWRQRIHQFSF